MSIVEAARLVTGGVDSHLDVHVAAVVDVNGGVLAVESFATTLAIQSGDRPDHPPSDAARRFIIEVGHTLEAQQH